MYSLNKDIAVQFITPTCTTTCIIILWRLMTTISQNCLEPCGISVRRPSDVSVLHFVFLTPYKRAADELGLAFEPWVIDLPFVESAKKTRIIRGRNAMLELVHHAWCMCIIYLCCCFHTIPNRHNCLSTGPCPACWLSTWTTFFRTHYIDQSTSN